MTRINQIAQAFARGVKFAENLKLAMDAAKGKDDEDGHWVTIGAEAGPDGEKHGGRPVFIKGAGAKSAKTESKPTSTKGSRKAAQQRTERKKAESKPVSKKAEVKKPASKKAETKKAAIKAAEDKYNLSIGDFLKSQKHAPGSFAKELMYCLPGKADTFEKLCANLSDDCKYLVKHTLSSVKYHALPPNGDDAAFYDGSDQSINFKTKMFNDGNYGCALTNHQVIIHEFGHAVDSYLRTKRMALRITMNSILVNAIKTDTSRIISALRVEANKHYVDAPSSQQVEDARVATYLSELAQEMSQQEDIPRAVVAGVSDMISAHTMNAIQDGGYHRTSYWSESPYKISSEFIAHVFETSIDPEAKKSFYKLFPTATKTLEILISNAANAVRKAVATGKIK